MVINPKKEQIIVWIAIPRTGTNFLCSLLNQHPLITSYFEIFHQQQFYSGYYYPVEKVIADINQQYGVNFSHSEDPNLVNWNHQNPWELIKLLKKFDPQRYVSFKLFPGHLDLAILKSIIINNNSAIKILVKRNLLNTYISEQIAIKINRWDNFDTSNIRLSLSVEKFAQWVDFVEKWYQLFENYTLFGQQKCFVINYEDIHAHKTNTEKLIYVDRFLNKIGITGEPYQIPDVNQLKITKKQDLQEDLATKIVNYQEFIQGLKDRGLKHYLRCN